MFSLSSAQTLEATLSPTGSGWPASGAGLLGLLFAHIQPCLVWGCPGWRTQTSPPQHASWGPLGSLCALRCPVPTCPGQAGLGWAPRLRAAIVDLLPSVPTWRWLQVKVCHLPGHHPKVPGARVTVTTDHRGSSELGAQGPGALTRAEEGETPLTPDEEGGPRGRGCEAGYVHSGWGGSQGTGALHHVRGSSSGPDGRANVGEET